MLFRSTANNLIITIAGGTGFASSDYWSATEDDFQSGFAWLVNFTDGDTGTCYKTDERRVRLVRDIK